MKPYKITLLFIALLSISFACSEGPDPFPVNQARIDDNTASLSNRVTMRNTEIGLKSTGQNAGDASESAVNFISPKFELVAEISSPITNGILLSATHIAIENDRAFVTYHTRGSAYGGGLDVIDLSNPNDIRITSQVLYEMTDFNALAIKTNPSGSETVFVAGATASGARVEQFTISNGTIEEEILELPIQGPNANGLAISDGYLYVTGGGREMSSGLHAISLTEGENYFNIVNSENYTDTKDVTVTGNNIIVLRGGGNASLEYYQTSAQGFSKVGSFPVGSINTPDGKNSIYTHNGMIYAAMSDAGLRVFGLISTRRVRLVEVSTDTFQSGLSNGVAVDENHIYIANGAAGLYLAETPSSSGNININGVLDLEGSANFVTANDSYIVVANGTGGIKILKRKPTEATLDLENLDVVYQTFRKQESGEYKGGRYGGPDRSDLNDPENSKKNQIQIPIDELTSLSEISFQFRSDQDYQINVYLGREKGQYDEKAGEFFPRKNQSLTQGLLKLDKTGYKYVIIAAVPDGNGYGRAYLENIEITGLK